MDFNKILNLKSKYIRFYIFSLIFLFKLLQGVPELIETHYNTTICAQLVKK